MFVYFFVLLTMAFIPFVVYVSAKLGVYGALVGRRNFNRDYPDGSICDGKE